MRFGTAGQPIKIGDRVRVWGGYDEEPHWLPEEGGKTGVQGSVIEFMKDRSHSSGLAVVRLDHPHTVDGVTGQILLLTLRHEQARWEGGQTVAVELCDFEPHAKRFRGRKTGLVVDIAATCELL